MYIDEQEIERSLSRQPAVPLFPEAAAIPFPSDVVVPGSGLAWLQETFDLSNFDLDIAAIALAPELDRRYERLYAYLQDDVTRKRPTVDLVLNLLCPDPATKLARRDRFSSDAPLIRHNLLHLVWDSSQPKPTLLTRSLQLDEQVIRFLLSETGLDSRLTSFCKLEQPAEARNPVSENTPLEQPAEARNPVSSTNRVSDNAQLEQPAEARNPVSSTNRVSENTPIALGLESQQAGKPLQLYFQGSDRPGKYEVAVAIAAELQLPLLQADLARIVAAKADLEATLKLIVREAQFQNALLYLDSADILQQREREILYESFLEALASNQGITILAGREPWHPRGARISATVTVAFGLPDFADRRRQWQDCLEIAGISISDRDLDALSDRFRLNADAIADVVAAAAKESDRSLIAAGEWHNLPQSTDDSADDSADDPTDGVSLLQRKRASILFATARTRAGRELAAQARKIKPKYSWQDIVLPPDQQTQLQEICYRAVYRHIVLEQWGFEEKLSLGKGLNVLFYGSPGTGKTMAAEVIASELQLDLYKIDLSQIVSKYIGETEKNLNRIFEAAANSNAILFFDEADALFGKRTEVKDAHDRYANIEVGYLLQKMEEYEGLAILTTNIRSNIDDAFVRRLQFMVEFPLPSQKQRQLIWEKVWPEATPRHADLDLDFFARRFEISGASIRNIALGAAFLAARDGSSITMKHAMSALRREYKKMGKILMEQELRRDAR
ncbi:MAG: ATP-binding protein [Oscillatoria sp. SIO1A7]|nr:ATP-binding protein [Oscillatoria sp. SIO1A7]